MKPVLPEPAPTFKGGSQTSSWGRLSSEKSLTRGLESGEDLL